MNKLDALVELCKCGVHLTVNRHRDYHDTAATYLRQQKELQSDSFTEPLAEPEILARMIVTDTIVELQFYPDTPIGSYTVWHHSIDQAIDEALAILQR